MTPACQRDAAVDRTPVSVGGGADGGKKRRPLENAPSAKYQTGAPRTGVAPPS